MCGFSQDAARGGDDGLTLSRTSTNASMKLTSQQQQLHHLSSHRGCDPAPADAVNEAGYGGGSNSSAVTSAGVPAPSLLQPRVAVVLGVPPPWHPLLFASRLLSVVPAIWWGLPCGLRLLVQLHMLVTGHYPGAGSNNVDTGPALFEASVKLMETLLAIIWCCASAYLSFFFTDSLMSRWLLNYTPQATIVRLLAINAVNGYLTSWVLYLSGGSEDPRLLLPAWVSIATTLTMIYHITQRKINIRKETSMTISVFSIASYITMVSLLAQLHAGRWLWLHTPPPSVPLVSLAKRIWVDFADIVRRLADYVNATKDL